MGISLLCNSSLIEPSRLWVVFSGALQMRVPTRLPRGTSDLTSDPTPDLTSEPLLYSSFRGNNLRNIRRFYLLQTLLNAPESAS